MTGIADMRASEHQLIAMGADIRAFPHQFIIPGTINGIAIEDGAFDTIVFQYQFFVDTVRCILEHDGFGAVIPGEISG